MNPTLSCFKYRRKQKLAAATFQIRSILVNKCLERHAISEDFLTILTHQQEQLISRTVEVKIDYGLSLTKNNYKIAIKNTLIERVWISLY